MQTTIRVNGVDHEVDVDPRTSLLDLLRDQLDLKGTKKGCDHGQCGACTVLVNGVRINACLSSGRRMALFRATQIILYPT